MPGTITISTLSDGTNSTSATNPILGSAKAWVNFDGSAGTITGSFNIGSITKNSTGSYVANFTTAMPNTNYATVVSLSPGSSLNPGTATLRGDGTGQYSTTQIAVATWGNTNTSLYDSSLVCIAVFSS